MLATGSVVVATGFRWRLVVTVAFSALLLSFLHVRVDAQDQRPQFAADVSLVRIDVIATDEAGTFVDDLGIDEFVLYEDDEVQRLTQAQLVDLRADGGVGARVAAGAAGGEEARGGGGVAGGQGTRVVRSSELGAMVFLIEPSALGYWAKDRFVEAWQELVAATEGYAAPKAVYALDELGRLHEILPLTEDADAMLRAGEDLEQRILRLGGVGTPSEPGEMPGLTEPDARVEPPRNMDPEELQRVAAIDARSDALRTIDVLEALAASFSFRRGRKTIVWVSSGVATTVRPVTGNALIGSSGSGVGVFSASGGFIGISYEVTRRLKELARTANSANVSIYGLDPTLVNERYARRRSSSASSRFGPADEFFRDPFDSRVASYNALRDSLHIVADSTGGKAYEFTTRVGEALEEVSTDVERYYLLAYRRAPEGDGSYREIRVETTRPGVTVRARAGYTDYSGEQLAVLRASSDLAFPEFSGTPALDFAVYRSWADDGTPRLQLAMELAPGGDVEAARDPARSFQLALSALDDTGRVVDERSELISWGTETSGAPPAVYVHDWPLDYGSYEIRVALVDRTTLAAAAGRARVEFPDPAASEAGERADDWRVTDAILLAQGPAGVPEPIIGQAMQGARPVGVYFECWTGREPRIEAEVALVDRTLPLPVSIDRMADGRYRVFVPLAPAAPEPGDVIRIEATDGFGGNVRSFEIHVGGRATDRPARSFDPSRLTGDAGSGRASPNRTWKR